MPAVIQFIIFKDIKYSILNFLKIEKWGFLKVIKLGGQTLKENVTTRTSSSGTYLFDEFRLN